MGKYTNTIIFIQFIIISVVWGQKSSISLEKERIMDYQSAEFTKTTSTPIKHTFPDVVDDRDGKNAIAIKSLERVFPQHIKPAREIGTGPVDRKIIPSVATSQVITTAVAKETNRMLEKSVSDADKIELSAPKVNDIESTSNTNFKSSATSHYEQVTKDDRNQITPDPSFSLLPDEVTSVDPFSTSLSEELMAADDHFAVRNNTYPVGNLTKTQKNATLSAASSTIQHPLSTVPFFDSIGFVRATNISSSSNASISTVVRTTTVDSLQSSFSGALREFALDTPFTSQTFKANETKLETPTSKSSTIQNFETLKNDDYLVKEHRSSTIQSTLSSQSTTDLTSSSSNKLKLSIPEEVTERSLPFSSSVLNVAETKLSVALPSSSSSFESSTTPAPLLQSLPVKSLRKPTLLQLSSEIDPADFSVVHDSEIVDLTRTTPNLIVSGSSETADDDSLFVGDKTLFSQDNTLKALKEFSTTTEHASKSTEEETEETTEENFGVPEFPRIEDLGPEATAKNYETVQTRLPIDFTENVGREPHETTGSAKKSHDLTSAVRSTSTNNANTFDIDGELKDISVPNLLNSLHRESSQESSTGSRQSEFEPQAIPAGSIQPIGATSSEDDRPAPDFNSSNDRPSVEQGAKQETKPIPELGISKNTGSSRVLHTHHTHIDDIARDSQYKTPFTFRITSIDYTPEFGDSESGKYKKLCDQLIPDLEAIFGAMFLHQFEGVHIINFMKGSVIVDGVVYTAVKPHDLEQLATEFEQRVAAKQSQIGGNDVDPRSIILDGYVSKNYVRRVHEGYTSDATSSYVVGGSIAIGIVAILLIAFAIIAMNNRRTNGTLKLKEENIAMTESGHMAWGANSASPVNLMGYGNGHQAPTAVANGQPPPMVIVGSQLSPMHMHAAVPHRQ